MDGTSSCACRAAEQAIARAAYDEANAYLERGFEAAAFGRGDTHAARAQLLTVRSTLLWRTRTATHEAAEAAALEAAAAARASGDPHLFGRAVLTLGTSTSGRLDPEVIALLDEALSRLGAADESLSVGLRAMRLFHRGFGGDVRPGDHAEGRTLIDAARRVDEWEPRIWALAGVSTVLRGSPDLDERRRYVDEWLSVTANHPDPLYVGAAYQVLTSIDLAAADRPRVLRDLAEYGRVRDEVGTVAGSAWDEIGAITDAMMTGRFAEADERIDRFVGDSDDVVSALISQQLWLRAEQGRLIDLEPALAGFENLTETYPIVVPMLAFANARLRRPEKALAMLHAAVDDDFAMLRRDWSWPVSLGMLAEAAVLTGDDRSTSRVHDELAPYCGQLLTMLEILCVGAADRYVAMLDACMERLDDSVAGFAVAYELENALSGAANDGTHAVLARPRDACARRPCHRSYGVARRVHRHHITSRDARPRRGGERASLAMTTSSRFTDLGPSGYRRIAVTGPRGGPTAAQ